MTSISAEDIIRLFEGDARARKRLAELLVSEPDVRLAVINAVIRDVATKQDLRELEARMEARLERLGVEVSALRERVSRLEGVVGQLGERISDLDKRIDSLDKRINSLDKRIDGLDKRIDALDKRIDLATRITIILTGSVIATLVASIVLKILG